MDYSDLFAKIGAVEPPEDYVKKESLDTPNLANVIDTWMRQDYPALYELNSPHVWVTGSRVWKHAYQMIPLDNADLDIILTSAYILHAIIPAMGLTMIRSTKPGVVEHVEGKKYHDERGRLIDIWAPGDLTEALQAYPRTSHEHARMAFCPATGELRMFKNKEAK